MEEDTHKKNDFEIVGILKGDYGGLDDLRIGYTPIANGKRKFSRLVIKRKATEVAFQDNGSAAATERNK